MIVSRARVKGPILAALCLLLPGPARAELRSELGFLPSYFEGEFGTGFETRILSFPATLVVRSDRHEVRLTLPYVWLTAPGPVSFLGDQVIGRAGAGRTAESGPGDVVLREEYFFVEGGRRRPWVSALLRAKLPTADASKGLGSGELDAGAGLGLVQPLGERWNALGQAQYVVRGDPPGADFRNTLWLSLGLQRRLSREASASLLYDRRQSVLAGAPDLADLSLAYDRSLARKLTLRAAVYFGQSRTSEDFGLVLGFTVR